MSMIQTESFLRNATFSSDLSARGNKYLHVFLYSNHYSWNEVAASFKGDSRCMGLGRLKNWVWFINEKGEPNIRRVFLDRKAPLTTAHEFVLPYPTNRITMPAEPDSCVYGYVIQIALSRAAELHEKLSKGRIRMCQQVDVVLTTTPIRQISRTAIIYYDPRHTADGKMNIHAGNREETEAWNNGFIDMRNACIPVAYRKKVAAAISGRQCYVEPIFLGPKLENPPKFTGFDGAEDTLFGLNLANDQGRVEMSNHLRRRSEIRGADEDGDVEMGDPGSVSGPRQAIWRTREATWTRKQNAGGNAAKRARNPVESEQVRTQKKQKKNPNPSFGPVQRPRRVSQLQAEASYRPRSG